MLPAQRGRPRARGSPRPPARRSPPLLHASRAAGSVGCEAVEVAVPAGRLQVLLAAAARSVRRVPGGRVVTAALPVVMADARAALRAVARPVVADGVALALPERAVEVR